MELVHTVEFPAHELHLIHKRRTLKEEGGVKRGHLRSVSGDKEYLLAADHMKGYVNFENFL